MLKIAALAVAWLAFLYVVTPLMMFGWAFAIPGMGSPGPEMKAILAGIPALWVTLAGGLLAWTGVPVRLALIGWALALLAIAAWALLAL